LLRNGALITLLKDRDIEINTVNKYHQENANSLKLKNDYSALPTLYIHFPAYVTRKLIRKSSPYNRMVSKTATQKSVQLTTPGQFWKYLILVSFQRDAAGSSLYFISLQDLSTCFGCSLHPSSGVLTTAYATTGTSHMMWQVSSVISR
jgi:hypothetical protein